jgi:hypothetical protein
MNKHEKQQQKLNFELLKRQTHLLAIKNSQSTGEAIFISDSVAE